MPHFVSRANPSEYQLSTIDYHGALMMVHEPSGVRFSRGNQLFRADVTHRYDKRGLDVSVRYAAGLSGLVSIYVHPFPPPRSVDLFDELFNSAVSDMLRTMTSTEEVQERRTAFAHASQGLVLGRRCDAQGIFASDTTTHIFDRASVELFVHQTWILKIRGTFRAATSASVEQFVTSWLVASGIGT